MKMSLSYGHWTVSIGHFLRALSQPPPPHHLRTPRGTSDHRNDLLIQERTAEDKREKSQESEE